MSSRNKKLSDSLEHYLEAIHRLCQEKGAARAKHIALRLGVNNSSVTGALHRLAERGLIDYEPYGLITLTEAGEAAARELRGRHDALYRFLSEVLGLEPGPSDQAACELEHRLPPFVVERLLEFVEFFDRCPVGGARWVEGRGYVCPEGARSSGAPDCVRCQERDKAEADRSS